MTRSQDQIPPIKAKLGTVEYQEQFEEQAQAASDQFLRHPIVRTVCAIFCVGLIAAVIREFVIAHLSLHLVNLTAFSGYMAIEMGRIALGQQAIIARCLLSGTQGRVDESDGPE